MARTAPKDELAEFLKEGVGIGVGDNGEDVPITSFEDEFNAEMVEPDLGDYDLSGVTTQDFRVLKNKAWYGAEIASAIAGNSKAGNPQIEFILKVVTPSEPNETAEGTSVEGVNVYVWAATPRPPLDKKKLNSLWTLKAIAGAVGLADLLPNGEVKCVKAGTKPSDFVGKRLRFRNEVDATYDPNNPRNKAGAFAALRA